jgi:SpoVK/Ycf46/Vps4 family AAA+-type ATPase
LKGYIYTMKSDILIESGQLIELMDAALSADYGRVRRIGSELANLCMTRGDEATAKQLQSFMRRKGVPLQTSGIQQSLPVDGASRLPLLEEEPWPSIPVFLNKDTELTISRFLRDARNTKVLQEGGLLTRFGLMLSGPPGTGKTLLAGHIAAQLRRPFFVARLDSLISSRLGETAKNIRQLFDFTPAKGGVLLLDELDAIAKMRDDQHELGELKRVVNTVIQGLDSLDDQAVVIAATNHPQLLDPAIWRRFPYRCDMTKPDAETRNALWLHFLYSDNTSKGDRAKILSQLSDDFTGADIQNIALATRRLALLNGVDLPEEQLLFAVSKSLPPNIQFPELTPLKREEKRELVRKATSAKKISKTELAKVLQVSRKMVSENSQEKPS